MLLGFIGPTLYVTLQNHGTALFELCIAILRKSPAILTKIPDVAVRERC